MHHQILSYASPNTPRHWSRTALAAMLMGTLCGPAILLAWRVFDQLPDGSSAALLGLALFLALPLAAFITSIVGMTRASSSDIPLPGIAMGALGLLASILWPLGIFFYVVTHLDLCC